MPLSPGYGRAGAPVMAIGPYLTNLESFAVHTTPIVVHEVSDESAVHSGFPLKSLWNSYEAWSAYGAEVPLTLNVPGGTQEVVQSYVPYLSGLQIIAASSAASVSSTSSGASDGSCEGVAALEDLEADLGSAGGSPQGAASPRCVDAAPGPRTGPEACPASPDPDSVLQRRFRESDGVARDSTASTAASAQLVDGQRRAVLCEHFERAPPHTRPPLSVAIAELAEKKWPGLSTAHSDELSPASWYAVAWYPLYSVPAPAAAGPARALQAAFLTFHALGTGGATGAPRPPPASPSVAAMLTWRASAALHAARVHPGGVSALRPFGLTPYKALGRAWRGGPHAELHAAASAWLSARGVDLPDFEFFDRVLRRAAAQQQERRAHE